MTRQQLLNIKGIHNFFTFGKFKGKMIKEVERAYLEFIVTKFEDKEEDVVKMARKFLVEGK